MNPYQALMSAAQGRPQMGQPQGIPVHHEKDPQYGQLEQALGEIDGELNSLPLGAPEYDELLQMKQALMKKKANIGAAHTQLEGRRKGHEAINRYGSILNTPGLENLERGNLNPR